MERSYCKAVLPMVLAGSLLSGCASTSSTGEAPLNQLNWPWCSLLGGAVGGGLGAMESSAGAGGGALAGAVIGGLLCYAQDGDEDSDGVFDRRDNCHGTPADTPVGHNGCPLPQYPATARAVEPPPTAPAPTDETLVFSDLGEVLFAFDSAQLTPAARATLDQVVAKLSAADVLGITVDGHTDSVGSDAYNQGLSLRRADSVAAYLSSQGVAAGKLKARGFGESRPVADNGSDAGRAQNRRVEIQVDR